MNKLFSLIAAILVLSSGPLFSQENNPTISNELLEELLQDRDNIIGVEVIVAASSGQRLYSRFGHTMLRLVHRAKNASYDYVLNFAADADEDNLSYYDGIVGNYQSKIEISRFDDIVLKYAFKEKRSFKRVIIPTTKSERIRMIELLLGVLTKKISLPNYSFFNENCSKQVLNYLSLVFNKKLPFIKSRIPSLVDDYLLWTFLSPYPVLKIATFEDIEKKVVKLDSTKEKITNILKAPEIMFVLKYLPFYFSGSLSSELKKAFRNGDLPRVSSSEMLRIVDVPDEVYQRDALNIKKEAIDKMLTLLSDNELKNFKRKFELAWQNIFTLVESDGLVIEAESQIIRSYLFLDKSLDVARVMKDHLFL